MASPQPNQSAQLILAGYDFKLTNVPERVNFGLDQQAVIHKIVGGARVVDMMGQDPRPIKFSTSYLNPDASDVADDLYALCDEKKLVNLQWGPISFDGIIKTIDMVYRTRWWYDFYVTFEVVQNVNDTGIGGGGIAATQFNFDDVNNGNTIINNANNQTGGTVTDIGDQLNQTNNGLNQTANSLTNGNAVITFA